MATPNELQKTQSICDKNISSRRVKFCSSTCGHNRFYKPREERSACCQQVEVLVRGSWRSHISALPASAPSWEGVEENRINSVNIWFNLGVLIKSKA